MELCLLAENNKLILSNCLSVHNFTLIMRGLEAGFVGGEQLGTQEGHMVEIVQST